MAKKKTGKDNFWAIIITAAATVILGIVLLTTYGERLYKPAPDRNTRVVSVYFSDSEGRRLKAETRSIRKGALDYEMREALGELLAGPKSGLGATIPKGVRLKGVAFKGGTAFADFSSELVANHPGGSSWELQTVYSIVNTLSMNFKDVKNVQILVEGQKEQTLAGHIDITMPLPADKTLVAN